MSREEREKMDMACLAYALVVLPFLLGLGYVVVVGAWRLGRFLWTDGGPLLAEGDPKAWTALGMVLFFVAVVAFITWDAGRNGGPNPRPGRKVYRGDDWHWEVDQTEYPQKPKDDPRRPPFP
ncbi:hypothetical protein K7395_25290 [Streptomyces filamentosus]|uniref:Integral membrane protein n=2 Tax=Streptomyces filamentosus TaxID=67294 RepID=A0ABY4V122_STRFL|nr:MULTISPECIES: hypothetical protein [Streptomyces]MYR78576.1 hypothetical protein [Streptomyces sp. SID5466]USC49802.1 hypothetical protein K7395_25290 [Streptomyces filamentosus]